MGLPRFGRPSKDEGGQLGPSSNLYVANCGPAVGISYEAIASVFRTFGDIEGVYAADESGARVIVCFHQKRAAQDALNAMDGNSCSDLGGRCLHIRYSVVQPSSEQKVNDLIPVSLTALEVDIPGIYLVHDFVNAIEEEELIRSVDARPWNSLSKRRVQHYGYEFLYDKRNVDPKHYLGELPSFVSPVLERIKTLPNMEHTATTVLDQLTVNEYQPGVGLSPHIDTHSAFEDLIFSLSLAGPCIMEFRKYASGDGLLGVASSTNPVQTSEESSKFLRRAIYLPPRSMLVLSGEARYAWHHYIPHHKIDMVNDKVIRRALRRVSFTLRKVRTGPCTCDYSQYCDNQKEAGGHW